MENFEFGQETNKFLDQQKIFEFGICEKNESIHDVFKRVSETIDEVENKFSDEENLPGFKEKLIHLLESQKFIPSTTILMNAGRFNNTPLSACSVPPVDLRNNLKDVKKQSMVIILAEWVRDLISTTWKIQLT